LVHTNCQPKGKWQDEEDEGAGQTGELPLEKDEESVKRRSE